MAYPIRSFLLVLQLCGTAILFCLLISCSNNALTRDKAEQLLSNANRQSFEQSCRLFPFFAGKPEFQDLQNSIFCDIELEVTGIRKITETQVVVEWKRITTARPDSLKKWLEAFNQLEQRLSALPGQRQSGWFVNQVVFMDPVDGEQFLQENAAKKSADIKDTKEWRDLYSHKERVESLLNAGKQESNIIETAFWLYDDGWRIGT
jgi:hypothetical protein